MYRRPFAFRVLESDPFAPIRVALPALPGRAAMPGNKASVSSKEAVMVVATRSATNTVHVEDRWDQDLTDTEAARTAIGALSEVIARLALRPDNPELIRLLWAWAHRLNEMRVQLDPAVLPPLLADARVAAARLAGPSWPMEEIMAVLGELSCPQHLHSLKPQIVRLGLALALAALPVAHVEVQR